MAFVIPDMEHWLEQEIAWWVIQVRLSNDPLLHEQHSTTELQPAPLTQ